MAVRLVSRITPLPLQPLHPLHHQPVPTTAQPRVDVMMCSKQTIAAPFTPPCWAGPARNGTNKRFEKFLSSLTKNQQNKRCICYGCNTEIASNVMRCENSQCVAFNDSAQGEHAQLLLDTNDELTFMPLCTTIKQLSMGEFFQQSDVL